MWMCKETEKCKEEMNWIWSKINVSQSVLSYISKISVFMSLLFFPLVSFLSFVCIPCPLCSIFSLFSHFWWQLPLIIIQVGSHDNVAGGSNIKHLNTSDKKVFFFFYIYLSNSSKDYSYNLSTIESPSGILVVFFPATGDTWSN